jgi:hypothetical protein
VSRLELLGPRLTLPVASSTLTEGMETKSRKLLNYPDQTRGIRLTAEVRKKANGHSPKQRAENFRKGMAMIYGDEGTKEASRV